MSWSTVEQHVSIKQEMCAYQRTIVLLDLVSYTALDVLAGSVSDDSQ